MTAAKRKTKILLLQLNLTFAQLAKAAGLALATVHNVLDGKASSMKSKQSITNALQSQIWPDVPVSRRPLTFGPHVEIDSPTVESAKEFARQFPPGYARRRGKTVFFLKEFEITLDEPESQPPLQ